MLLHIVRSKYPEVPAVFSDTGLEFPEIRDFVKSVPDVTWIRPDMTFKQVIEKYGYPVISKEQSEWIYRARIGNPNVYRKNVLVSCRTAAAPGSIFLRSGATSWTRPSILAQAAALK